MTPQPVDPGYPETLDRPFLTPQGPGPGRTAVVMPDLAEFQTEINIYRVRSGYHGNLI